MPRRGSARRRRCQCACKEDEPMAAHLGGRRADEPAFEVERIVARAVRRYGMHAGRAPDRGVASERLDEPRADAMVSILRCGINVNVCWIAFCQRLKALEIADVAESRSPRRVVEAADEVAGDLAVIGDGDERLGRIRRQITPEPTLQKCGFGLIGGEGLGRARSEANLLYARTHAGHIEKWTDRHHALRPAAIRSCARPAQGVPGRGSERLSTIRTWREEGGRAYTHAQQRPRCWTWSGKRTNDSEG